MTQPQNEGDQIPPKLPESTMEFHENCGHYGDDYEESTPEGAEVVQGEPYCARCWSQIVDTGYPHSNQNNARRHNYRIRI